MYFYFPIPSSRIYILSKGYQIKWPDGRIVCNNIVLWLGMPCCCRGYLFYQRLGTEKRHEERLPLTTRQDITKKHPFPSSTVSSRNGWVSCEIKTMPECYARDIFHVESSLQYRLNILIGGAMKDGQMTPIIFFFFFFFFFC